VPTDVSWEQLSGMTQQMRSAADNGDWEKLSTLETKRQPVLQAYFSRAVDVVDADIIRSQINHIQFMDAAIIKICQYQKDATFDEMHGLQRGKTAGNAYLSNTAWQLNTVLILKDVV